MAHEKNDLLKETLKKIASGEVDAESAAAQLDAELARECTVMISDFSSFLGLAMAKGIVSALGMVEKAHNIAEPILGALGGEVLRADSDGLVVIFSNPVEAVMAARAVSRTFEENNSTVGGGDQLAVSLGIGQGKMLVTDDQVYGEQAILAARLGEAVEGSFEVGLTPEAFEGVKHLESLAFTPGSPIMVAGETITPHKLIFA